MEKQLKIVIDTNLWISFLISKKFIKLENLLRKDELIIIMSQEQIDELFTVAKRDKFRKYFKFTDFLKLMEEAFHYLEIIEVTSSYKLCVDSKDNFLLNLSVDGKADFLISGDDDLLRLNKVQNTKIVKYSDFIKYL